MFGIFKKRNEKPYNWKKEHARLWESLVPAEGQAETLQGELIRIADKLTDQAFRNGNTNWDAPGWFVGAPSARVTRHHLSRFQN